MPETPPFELFQLGTEGDPALLNWLMLQSGTIANRPAASSDINGAGYIATDEYTLYRVINGAWAVVFVFPNIANFQRFTSSSTWNKPPGASWVLCERVGGGGDGVHNSNRTGGWPGQIVRTLQRASELSGTESVTVGAAGGNSIFDGITALGGSDGIAISISDGIYELLPSGIGGGAASGDYLRGKPGIGLSSYTPAASDGANSNAGTGSGGGGAGAADITAGDGGVPGGGGGSAIISGGRSPGDGARGEVRVWSW